MNPLSHLKFKSFIINAKLFEHLQWPIVDFVQCMQTKLDTRFYTKATSKLW